MLNIIPFGDIFDLENITSYAHGCNCAGACGDPMEDSYLMLTGEPYESEDWEKFFDNAVKALKEILSSGNKEIDNFFGARIITTGFDDGNLVRLR